MNDRSAALRARLASVGIFLEDDERPAISREPSLAAAAPLDREKVRAILVAAGAPSRDLEWLTASCPSLEAALNYLPPRED